MNNNDKKAQFHEALTFLIESANINDGKVTLEEIRSTFDGIIDDDSMYQLIYDYLSENKIIIQGYISNPISNNDDNACEAEVDIADINVSTDTEDNKEKNFVDMYYKDLENITDISTDMELSLLDILINKSSVNNAAYTSAIHTLTESNLNMVIKLAEEYRNKGVSMGDLIQEGNLGLMEGIMTYEGSAHLETFHYHLEICIKNALNDAVLEQNASSRISTHAADRANELDRASVALSKELERTPTLKELADYLSLPEEEIEQIMKMSLNALTLNENMEE